ncbi:MAG: hypothetical protein MUE68_12890 [Bacteroidetes bacterium]|nr:hypothetical protein [Bacteroidota bacterium]
MSRSRREANADEIHGHGSADQIPNGIFADVAAWAGKQSAHDDRTLVAVKVQ